MRDKWEMEQMFSYLFDFYIYIIYIMKTLFTFFFGYLAGLIRFLGFGGILSFTAARYESLKKMLLLFFKKNHI